jgi:carnitine O-acetyltransferase
MFSRAAELLHLEESLDALPEPALPVLLDWRISAASACKLAAAGEAFIARKNRLDLARLVLPEYSRARVKALRCSPDAFLQMGFQAAQYQCLPRFSSSYEAVSMRAFAEGRTECARGSSAEAGALAEALCRCRPAGEIRELFRKAEARHLDRLEQCRSGQGVERYMLGLESMYLLYGQALGVSVPPALFANPGWQFVKRNLLSTSGSVSSVCNAFGFGPPDPEGFGLGYNYGAALTVTVTGFPQSSRAAEEFAAALKNHLDALFSALAGA